MLKAMEPSIENVQDSVKTSNKAIQICAETETITLHESDVQSKESKVGFQARVESGNKTLQAILDAKISTLQAASGQTSRHKMKIFKESILLCQLML
jgi:hypothetical protein